MIAALLRLFAAPPAPRVCNATIKMVEGHSGTFTGACDCGHPINTRTYAEIREAHNAHLRYSMNPSERVTL